MNQKLIPEIPIYFRPESEEAKAIVGFKWADDEIGKRSKLGGKPDWIQSSEVPICSCGKEMSFYGQLDSIGDAVILADCGMIYIFVCFDCFETKSMIQSF